MSENDGVDIEKDGRDRGMYIDQEQVGLLFHAVCLEAIAKIHDWLTNVFSNEFPLEYVKVQQRSFIAYFDEHCSKKKPKSFSGLEILLKSLVFYSLDSITLGFRKYLEDTSITQQEMLRLTKINPLQQINGEVSRKFCALLLSKDFPVQGSDGAFTIKELNDAYMEMQSSEEVDPDSRIREAVISTLRTILESES